MLQGVNIEDIKKYNSSLKQCRDRAASLKAEIEYTNKEIDTICNELSAELGITVTRDNIEQIYNEQLEKINSALQSGNAVLAKIASEESSNSVYEQPAAQQSVIQPQVEQPVQNTAPQMTQQVPPMAPPVFTQPQVGGTPLPNFFGN